MHRPAVGLRAEFTGARGCPRANPLCLRASAEAWPKPEAVQRGVGRWPWGQGIEHPTKLKDPESRRWYAEAAMEHGCSRPVLAAQSQTRLRDRAGRAVTNFARVLPPPGSGMARQIPKDPHRFDFPSIAPDAKGGDLEQALVGRVQDLVLETCCSSIAGCDAWSRSIPRSGGPVRSMPAR